ncbi:MAG: UDP-N-acetylmuramate--L-alanine ligase [Propionibacteriaceae bacterium]|nr:UDP-N-acetylmuramate--L-alanine ligase [Propionibacteriaceae bacterium]
MPLIDPVEIPALSTMSHVHFIAIGGAGMSGIAAGYLARGLRVSGSDQADSVILEDLRAAGAEVWVGHDAAHLSGADAVVVSSAIRADNVELVEAHRLGLPILHRSLALASLIQGSEVVSIAGTHGKTTTTAMCVAGLTEAGQDPSYVIGGTVLATGLGAHIGTGSVFILEADESDGSFRQYPTTIAVITGIEVDHSDNWGTLERYVEGFTQFATGKTVGTVILHGDDPGAARLGTYLREQGRTVISYGSSPDNDVRLTNIDLGARQASLNHEGKTYTLQLGVPGVHNLYNATAAYCVGHLLGADAEQFLTGLASFGGTARRFQVLGESQQITVIDDYAHHPTEVRATIAAARLVCGEGRVIVCFQPHLFSRTLAFADEFGQALAAADEVVVLDIYPAREDPIPGVTGKLVAESVEAHGGVIHYVPDFSDAPAYLANLGRPGDLILTVGAGSVTTIGPLLLARLGL